MSYKINKIFLKAYLDNNLGDDLMVMGLLKKYPDILFYTVSSNSLVINTFSKYDNLIFISKKEFFNSIDEFSLYLKVGGSIFQYNNIRDVVAKLLDLLKLKKLKKSGARSAVIGSNLGPFNAFGSQFVLKRELVKYDLVTVRDSESFNKIAHDFKLSNVEKFDDSVFELMDLINKDSIININKEENSILGLSAYRSIRNIELNFDFYKKLAMQIAHLYKTESFDEVRIFAFDSEKENDLSAAYHIKNILYEEYLIKSKIIPYLGNNLESFLNDFREVNYMIAIRFHSAILSDYYRIPYYPIAYSNKMINYMVDSSSRNNVFNTTEFIDNVEHISISQFSNRVTDVSDGHLKELDNLIKK